MKHCPRCGRTYPDKQRFCLDDGALLSLRDPYHLVGRTLAAKYRLDALVGVGGMGAVYSAYHLALDRRVAFKILQPNLTLGNERTLDLFEREARMAGRLVHENIVLVLDAGRTADDIAYIAMEWLDGHTLEGELATSGPFSLGRAAEILRQVAAALDAAHAERIIHRDLKPANIMLVQQADGRERVKVLDFGIAKILSETAGSPVSSVMGTPHYASPEQFQLHGRIDARTDIYSLGVVLFQMLTGALPFEATSVHELIQLRLTTSPPPLRTLRPDAPAEVERLLDQMLAREPERRPARVSEIPALFDSALNVVADQEKEEVQHERQQPGEERPPTLYEATELLPPPPGLATSPQTPSQLMDLLAAPDTVKMPQVDSDPPVDEPHPPPSQLPQSQTGLLSSANRMHYVFLGGILILVAGLAVVTLRFIVADSGPNPDTGQPTVEPTGQARIEPSQNPAQSPAVITSQPSTQPTNSLALNTVNGRWAIHSNDTVLDTQTGLMWMKKDFRVIEGRFTNGWQEAMAWAKKMNNQQYAGHSDWKVPSISEYKSIRDRASYSKVFERQGEDCYWSRNEISQWVASYIYMSDGAATSGSKNEGSNKPGVLFNGKFSVRLVRQAK